MLTIMLHRRDSDGPTLCFQRNTPCSKALLTGPLSDVYLADQHAHHGSSEPFSVAHAEKQLLQAKVPQKDLHLHISDIHTH